ncbi:MAG: endonuclease/exonuclease/phosphatase family protein [Paraprevotella sp.]|nr:endonuclease/exonuclease/phosphatase family protein [Paraprevotella sp.]
MNFLFWNIHKKTSFYQSIGMMMQNYDINILMIAELEENEMGNLLSAINSVYGKEEFVHIPGYNWKKVMVFAQKDIKIAAFDESGTRICAFKIFSEILQKDIILFPLHFYDKYNFGTEEQNERIIKIKDFIEEVENRNSPNEKMSIVCGDFNLNPYETPMIKTRGMHAVMDRRIAEKEKRTVEGNDYHYFYNPMWGFYGDNGKGGTICGTYFLNRSCHIELFWHLLDQVIIRPKLMEYFDDKGLEIITQIDDKHLLLNEKGKIDPKKYSDHLPLKFCVNI